MILVVDAKGMGRSVVSLVAGFLDYDSGHLIRDVILNRMSKGYYKMIKPLLEKELNIPVMGFLPENKEMYMESRHLGLVLPDERNHIKAKLAFVSEKFPETVSIEEIVKTAEMAEEPGRSFVYSVTVSKQYNTMDAQKKPVIAVAKDEAFCFYYADNILMLKENGAEIKYFSPLHDQKLPDGCHALLIGGGYPELYARALSENEKMSTEVKHAVFGGMPIVAECGGFMYLHTALKDRRENGYEMAGVIPAVCQDTGKPVRFGYIEISEKKSNFLPEGETIKGHEFHYYDSTDNGTDATAKKPVTGREYPCIIERENCWIGFPHLYYPSNPAFARQFVAKARTYLFLSENGSRK